MTAIGLDGSSLTLDDLVAIARQAMPVFVKDEAQQKMQQSCDWVLAAADGQLVDQDGEELMVYGVNTGYGSLARVRVDRSKMQRLSWNLIRSHAAGMGPPVAEDAVRAMMLLRANALAKGASGCRPALVTTLCQMLGKGVTPIVPQRGSCGSSGDLAPLAHLGLVLFRGDDPAESGRAMVNGEVMTGERAMESVGLTRLYPGPKEGLAMTNGAQLTTAITALVLADACVLLRVAEIAAAMSWEALRGVTRALNPQVHALRPFPGAITVASHLLRLMEGSDYTDSMPDKVQDAYSLRCTPQVLGAARDGLTYAIQQVRIELNSVTDNPIILLDEEGQNKAFSAGLFHGEPVGFAADHAKLSLCEIGSLSERRVYRLTTGHLSSRLPALLAKGADLNLGLMVPQTTAASLVASNRQLAWPCSADTIPTCEDQEDHVAMSTTAARRAQDVADNVRRILAIELMAAMKGLNIRRKNAPSERFGAGTTVAFERCLALIDSDTLMDDLGQRSFQEELVRAVEQEIGEMKRL